jgi:hypothetical protein
MNKDQLRNMRAILASEVNRSAFPKLSESVLADLAQHGWLESVGGAYKSTQAGRQAVLAAGRKP